MKILISTIKIEKHDKLTHRVRKDFGDIQELAESIKKHGIIQPIVVDELKNDPEHQYTLVAGERRITASLFAGKKDIDAVVRAELSPLQRKEIELEENARRKDLAWEETIEATYQLDKLKRSIHGTRMPGDMGSGGWTIKDTADYLGLSLGTVSQDITLAKDLNDHPELRKKVIGMTKQVARKTIEREKEALIIASKIRAGKISADINLFHGKAEEEIIHVPDSSIDCLITDPPFAVDAISDVERGALSGKYAGEANVGESKGMMECYKKLFPHLKRVMKPGAHFYMFFGIDWYSDLLKLFTDNGFIAHAVPLIWNKGRGTMVPNPYHYVPSYEFILFGVKAPYKRTLLKPRNNCFDEFPADAPQKRVHPLQKPYALIRCFIENSTVPGETVLDCFAGSGIVLKVANDLGRKGIGFEMNEINYLKALEFIDGK